MLEKKNFTQFGFRHLKINLAENASVERNERMKTRARPSGLFSTKAS